MKGIVSRALSVLVIMTLSASMMPTAAFGLTEEAGMDPAEDAADSESALPPFSDENTEEDTADIEQNGDTEEDEILEATPAPGEAAELLEADGSTEAFSIPEEKTVSVDDVTAFVTRLYTCVLGREPDVGGLKAHVESLRAGNDGAVIAWGFFGSPEFANRPLSNEERVRIAYLAMFDREPDPTGKATFMGKLASGMSMRSVISDFSRSAEYRSVCARWGIAPGALYVSEPRDQNQSVTEFVQRLYQKVLGRSADVGGLNAHTDYLLHGGNAGTLSWSFFSAPEFSNKNLSNADKVEHVYLAMLDRPSDPAGKADWVGRLNGGESLYSVVSGFFRSHEFRDLCRKYGIYAGAITGDTELDSIIDSIISRYGTDLYALYDYVASYPYIGGSKYPTGNWTPGFAKEMYWNGGGNCYRYAALFEQLARASGYEAHAVAGHVLNRYGGWNAHGWVEVYINGATYVCDPQSTHAISGRNFYMITYDNAPLTYRTW